MAIVCSRSVGRGLRAEVYVTVECSYFAVDGMPIEMYVDSERREESNGTYCAFMA